jgi:hypothetical protein
MKSKMTTNDNGDIKWKNYKGQFHREDGPAFEDKRGYKSWWINGEKHREDGPAVELYDVKSWFLNNNQYTEQEYKYIIRYRKLKELLK